MTDAQTHTPFPSAPAARSRSDWPEPDWLFSPKSEPYAAAVAQMESWADEIARGTGRERIWLLEHPALYTAGTSSKPEHLRNPERLPVFEAGRGGGYTYHGPGQRLVYLMLNVRTRFDGDVRAYVCSLEDWLIAALARLGVQGHRGDGARGVWVYPTSTGNSRPEKIASIGVRIRRGVALHGVSLNVAPDLAKFDGIVACGGSGEHQTSLKRLGAPCDFATVDTALRQTFADTVLSLR